MFDKKSDVVFYFHSTEILLDITIRENNFHYKTSSSILISAMTLVLLPGSACKACNYDESVVN